jgi:adenylyltransferase/sulfurtransferase
MPGLQDEDLPACGVVGVHPSVLGIVSSVQVSEAVRVLTGQEPKLFNKLLYVDLREFEFNILEIPMLDTCMVCGTKSDGAPQSVKDRFFEETCARDGRRNFVVSPNKRLDIDMDHLANVIVKQGMGLKIRGRLGITFEKSDNITACILKSGIMIAQSPPELEKSYKTEVIEIYTSILMDGFGLSKDILPEI